MDKVLIKGGRVVTAVDDYVADILVENGRIEAIARNLDVESAQCHDATGLLVMPGGIDVHVHLFDPNQRHTLSASTHHSNVDYSLFEGRSVLGKVKKVFLRGQLIVDEEEWLGRAGMGQYQHRSASGRIL